MTRALGRMARASMRPVGVVLAVLLSACESTSGSQIPVTPSTPVAPAPPAPRTHTLSGVITAEGHPAVGTRVTVLETQPEPSATADNDGRYNIPGLQTSSIWGRTLVRFSKEGYFTEFKRPLITQDTRLDVALDPLVFISVGDAVRGSVTGDAVCAGQDYEPDPCQRFAVVAPMSGTLEVTLASEANPVLWALDIVNPEGHAVAQFNGSPKRMSIPAAGGGTYQIRVLGMSIDFELMTSLK